MHACEFNCRACGCIDVNDRGQTLLGGRRYRCERCGFTSRTPNSPVNLVLAVILLSVTGIGMVAYAAIGQLVFPGILAFCVAYSLNRSQRSVLDRQAAQYRSSQQYLDAKRLAQINGPELR